jgi:hypothetical protein
MNARLPKKWIVLPERDVTFTIPLHIHTRTSSNHLVSIIFAPRNYFFVGLAKNLPDDIFTKFLPRIFAAALLETAAMFVAGQGVSSIYKFGAILMQFS